MAGKNETRREGEESICKIKKQGPIRLCWAVESMLKAGVIGNWSRSEEGGMIYGSMETGVE